MVRGRRVRAAVVACVAPQPDNCCSPNAKRKDMPKCSAKTNQPIAKYFQAVTATSEPIPNNLRNGNHYEEDAIHLNNGIQEIKSESIKSPATPHRIQLPTDTINDNQQQRSPKTTKTYEQQNHRTFTMPSQVMQHTQPSISKVRKKLLQSNTNIPAQQTHISSFFPSVRRSVRKTKTTVLEEKQRRIEDLIRNNVEGGLMVREFTGKGRGVVAARIFERGDYVVEYSGELIDMTVAKEREERYARDDRGCYMYYFSWKNKQYCIDATVESGRLGRLVNHSRTAANLSTRIVPIDGAPRLCLVARDTVPAGDEVTYDYGDRTKESLQHHPWLAY